MRWPLPSVPSRSESNQDSEHSQYSFSHYAEVVDGNAHRIVWYENLDSPSSPHEEN